MGSGVQRRAGVKPSKKGPEHAPINDKFSKLNENKTQNVSNIDELLQENESLKKALKEYKDSFVVLRKQINEVQTFNAKLAYVNKLFANGGLNSEEKIQIAEQFDKVDSIEDAKKLYNQLIKENTTPKNKSIDNIEKKLQSAKPVASNPSTAKTLYESVEMSRMKKLAGI